MKYIRLLFWVSLLVIPLSALATGNLEVIAGKRSAMIKNGIEKNKPVTVELNLCVASVVWANGWQPEPFWISMEPVGNTVGHTLGPQGNVQVKFSFLVGSHETPIYEGMPSAPIVSQSAKPHCAFAFGYTLKAVLSVANHGLLSGIYLGEFLLRLNWGYNAKSSTVKYTFSVHVPHTVKISGLKDLLLVDNGANKWVAANNSICVYSQTSWGMGTSHYIVTADGAGVLSPPGSRSRSIPYQLFWKDAKGSKRWHDLNLNVPMDKQKGSKEIDCADGHYSALRVEADKITTSGTYTDKVTLTVAPY